MFFINTLPHIPCEWFCLSVRVHRDTPLWLSRQLRMSDLTFKHVIITKIWLCVVFLFLLYFHEVAFLCSEMPSEIWPPSLKHHRVPFWDKFWDERIQNFICWQDLYRNHNTLFFFSVLYFSSEKYSNFSSLISELYHFTSFYGSFMSSLGDFTKRKLMQSNINNVTRKKKSECEGLLKAYSCVM